MSTWLAGRNTLTPISTSKPPLILRVTVPVTMSPSCTVSMTRCHCSIFCGLALAELDHAGVFQAGLRFFDLLDQHLDDLAGLRRFVFGVPFVERDRAFALVADVDQHQIAFDAEHAPLDDLVECYIIAAPFDFIGVVPSRAAFSSCSHSLSFRSKPRIRFRLFECERGVCARRTAI